MSKKWLWLTIVAVAASFLIVATVARRSEPKQSEVAVSPRQAPAPAPLTFRERKARGLLTPEEQAGVEELAQMRAEAEKYNRERQARIARERAEKAAAYEQAASRRRLRASAEGRWVGKYQVEHMPGETAAEYQQRCRDVEVLQDPRLPALVEQMMERDRGPALVIRE